MNKYVFRIPQLFKIILEILILVILVLFFVNFDMVNYLSCQAIKVSDIDGDSWLKCSLLEYQITRILGVHPGGLWETMQFFPFHKVSLFFSEPTWGVSLAMVPLWLIKPNIFLLVCVMPVLAMIFSWMATYWFAIKLGCKRKYAFLASMTFCLSGVASLIMNRYFFWPFFLVPVLGCLIIKIFQSDKFVWPVLFGLGFGYLAWSSAHLFIMGGVFLLAFAIWKLWEIKFAKKKIVAIFIAFLIAFLLSALLYIPMYLVHREFSRPTVPGEQFFYATNFANLIHSLFYHPFNPFNKLSFWNGLGKYAKGEQQIGISVAVFLLFIYFSLRFLFFIPPTKLKINLLSKIKMIAYYSFPILLAVINVWVLKKVIDYASVDIFSTVLTYFVCGGLIVFFRHKLKAALRNLPFLFFVLAVIFALFAFGPYYITWGNKAIPSPLINVLFFTPGFSGIRAVARWGILLSFCLSLGVSLSLSNLKTNLGTKVFINLLIILSFLELFRGLQSFPASFQETYQWKPRPVDIFLKSLPYGGVLELESYPIAPGLPRSKNLGYEQYSALYHKKPVVTGNGALVPQVVIKYFRDQSGGKLDCVKVAEIRKFGARYWVLHMDKWPKEDNFNPNEDFCGLKRIARLDNGDILVYEDPDPQIAVRLNN